ncbi:MAG TPA: amino acid adenylation domain-containing protein [Longimicrobium sp.]
MTEVSKKLGELSPEQRKLLALRLRMQKAKESAPAPQEREGGVFPLSFAQQRMWLLDRLDPGATAYNLAFPWRLRGPLDVPALERAVAEIVRRHETLRTRIDVRDGEPAQVVEPFREWTLPVVDRPIPEAEREAELARIATEEANRPFDLAAGPLFRALLVRAADDDHLFVWSVHHVVGDGWSTGVFDRELKALYEAFAAGRSSPLPPLPIQYGDFAVRQRERLSGEALERQVAWWKDRLAGAPALLELPTDRPRPAVRSDRGDVVGFEVEGVAAAVEALAREADATPFMVLLAAWQALLGRWSGQDDVLVGTPIASRTTPDVEPLIGYFANTLVLRGDLGGDPTFRALLARVREATLGAYEHQDLPFEKLVEEINPGRSLSHTPLFQVAFVFQNLAAATGITEQRRLGDAAMEPAGRGRETAKFDLTLTLVQDSGRTLGSLEYAAELWDRATVERMIGHLGVLLREALRRPDARISDLPLLMDAERVELEARARPAAAFAADEPLHVRFAAQAARSPDAVAATYEGERLTYAELDARANRLAHHLAARGTRPGDLVGLCVERSLETVVGILGILKAGAAYLPLDPAYPDERIAHMLADSGARLVLATADLASRVSGDGITAILLDSDRAEIDAHPSIPPAVEVDGDALAYVIYTSGSTGRPKGVQVTHANVMRLFAATDEWFGFGADDVWTLFHSYAFDFSVWEIWGSLLYGGRLVVVPFYVSRNPDAFRDLLARERVTVLNQTPSAFRQLIRADEEAWGDRSRSASGGQAPARGSRANEFAATTTQSPPSRTGALAGPAEADPDAGSNAHPAAASGLALRCVIFGGEALDPASLRGWVERHGDEAPRLVNMYGITETTVHVTYRVIREADVLAGSASPIGIPIPDLSVQVLDPRGRPVPVGVVGEMYVGGAGVARGYLGRPALTAERFVPDPYPPVPGARLYRSGDLARWTEVRECEGAKVRERDAAADASSGAESTFALSHPRTLALEYLGRADDQVKVRGFRIELGEIESVLLEHPRVREAVVLARGSGDDKRLVAWVVPSNGDAAVPPPPVGSGGGGGERSEPGEGASAARLTAELRAHLSSHLPDYMVPSAFVAMDALPLTRNGKVDRRALPEPDLAASAVEYVAPRTPDEETLAGIWAPLLGVPRVGAEDEFFALGGHSLLATRVITRVREAFGVDLPLRAVFESPTLSALAAEIGRLAGTGTEAPPIVPVDRTGDLPLTFAQERLWFVDRMEPGSMVVTMGSVYRLSGALDAAALERALGEVVRRHESLRSVFPEVDGTPVQRVLPWRAYHLPTTDLKALPEDERGAAAGRIVREPFTTPFDLARGPLLRAVLVRLDEGEHLFAFNLHHVAGDGWSLGIFFGELAALYDAFARGEPSPLAEPAVQFGDYAAWQRAWLRGEVLERQLAYWRGNLAGAPPLLELPTDRPRPAVQSYRGADEHAVLPADELAAIHALGRAEGATLFMTLLAAFSLVLGRLAGHDDVVVGTPIAGRTRAETERLIGLFLNSLAMRTDLGGDPSFRELLRRVRRTTLDAYAHQDVPFELLLAELQPRRSVSHTPVFQVMLNLQNYEGGEMRFGGVEVEGYGHAGEQTSKFDLTLYATEMPDGLALRLVYARDLFGAARMRELLDQLRAVLAQAAADPDAATSRITLQTEMARAVLPDPAAELSNAWRGSVPELFARRACEAPHALAAEDPRERWTYAELDADTAEIANDLVAAGLGSGDVVAIWGHRGTALVRALLATLRSGAAFLVLDPAYPPARLADYVRIAQPKAFLEIPAAGDIPAELESALAETVRCGITICGKPGAVPAGRHPEAGHTEPASAPEDAGRRIYSPGEHTAGDASESHPGAAVIHGSAEASPAAPASGGYLSRYGRGGEPKRAGEGAPAGEGALPESRAEIGPDTLAYLSFTSGTTGTPKAVMGRHGSLTHFTPWLAETFGLSAGDRFSLLSGLAHDPLHRDVFTPLQLGAAVVAPEPDEVAAPGYLARWMREAGITVAHLTPAMGQLIADVPGGVERAAPVESLRRAFFVGDVLTRGDVERLGRLAPNLTVVNYYGSTETQRAVAYHVVQMDEDGDGDAAREVIPLGRGIPGVQLLVRSTSGGMAGIGEVGEVWLRSPHVALGYLGDADLTASRFVRNPWRGDAWDVLYRTGDLGRYRPDGEVEPMGRADQQVKVRGFRVELGDIEAALARHRQVREAVVIARGDAADRRLIAYIVPQRLSGGDPQDALQAAPTPSLPQSVLGEGQARNEPGRGPREVAAAQVPVEGASPGPDPETLRAHLRASLPEFMLPAAFVTLERLPLTQNGKVDRRALPDPAPEHAETRTAPRTETERAVAEIWREVLGHEVGVEDDFFASGGHSLRATQVLSRIEHRFAVRLPVKTIFAAPTVAALAAEIDARGGDFIASPDTGEFASEYGEGVYPLSFAQQRLWLLDRLEPGSAAYNLPAAYRIRGALDAPALERALGEIVRRHETLRTRIETRGDDEPVQVVDPADDFHLPIIEKPEIADDELRRIATDEAARPFDLARGPLFRAMLVRIAADDHALLWTLHHAISDGWSTGILLRELNVLYSAFAADPLSTQHSALSTSVPDLPIQYGQHAVRQRRRLSGAALDEQVRVWKEALAGAPSLLDLPTDWPRPAVQSYRGATLGFGLPDELMARVAGLARREGATPFMVLLAAYQAVLSRWSGQNDVVVGTPVANRTSADVEPLIGFFANTLALRGDLSGAPTFRELLARVREASLFAFDRQDLPFEKLVEELQPERSLAHSPVFQVMFALQNVPREGPRLDGLEMSPIGRAGEAAKFDLSLTLVQAPDRTFGAAEYATDLFDEATIQRFVGHFATLLDAATQQPDARVADLPLMPDAERDELMRISAGPEVAREPSLTLHGLFEAQAARTPDTVAVTFEGRSLTYAEMDGRANQLAHLLRARGVGPETPVAVFMERSLEMVIALYGVLKAGGCYIPVDPEYPAERIAYMLEDSAARVVLTQQRWMEMLPAPAEAIALDAPGVLDGFPSSSVDGDADPDALAYVIYTSGSTGRPKGAGNAHRGIVNRILWMQETFALGADDVVLQKTPFSFDVSVWEFFWPLMAGARLAVAAPGAHRDPARLTETIARERVTTLHFVPSMLRLWLDEAAPERVPTLRRIVASGEALPPELRDRFFTRLPGVELHNLYGPTEAAVDVTWHPCVPGEAAVPIGRPVANTRIHVLDARGNPCPPGVPGELHIAGVQVGRGYQHRPALTAERFVPDPFADHPGARMYRTGDRARWTEVRKCESAKVRKHDGEDAASPSAETTLAPSHSRTFALEYLGRYDFQVKIRGLRVELGEIEAALAADPSVREAVVAARGEGEDARLVAWVVPADGDGISADVLRERLGRALPPYMVPGAFVEMDALPLTPSGKVDRKSLPDPDMRARPDAFVAPWTATEIELADVWREVLGVERVGAADDFFALGGHSLLAVKLASRIRQRFGRELPLAELFRSRTLRALAAALERDGGGAPASPLVALLAGGTRTPIFCVHPAGGTVFRYADLSRHLGPSQPFYGLQAQGVNDDAEPLATVDEMAERYLDAIRDAFPRGPYVLAGWSAGGVIAYEMARRLGEMGEAVPLVVLLDTHAPNEDWETRAPDEVDLYLRYTHDLAGVGPERLAELEMELRPLAGNARLPALAAWIARSGLPVAEATLAQIGRSVRVFATTMRAVNEHRLGAYAGDVLLVEAADGIPGLPAPEGGIAAAWRPHVRGSLEVRTVPGTHGTFISDPYAAEVARVLEECFARSGNPAVVI